ncbi:hypothetical protein ABS71_06870 [bacterium SCN 62-11]|nr:MAG: hypothetical protein ABS71_06870 [bacterium SCN 62-11]
MSLKAGENKRARSNFVGSLRRGATLEEVTELLGQPEDVGQGARGFKILAYRERKLQLTFRRGCLFLVAFYFEPTASRTKWPLVFPVPDEFSGSATEEELESWPSQRGYAWQKIGNLMRVDDEVSLVFEDGKLSSIQILDNLTTQG